MSNNIYDYPFNDWKNYYEALTQMLKGDINFNKKYPIYYKQLEKNIIVDTDIVDYLLDMGLNPTNGINGFINVILQQYKHAFQFIYQIDNIIKLFIDAGAELDLTSLFSFQYPEITDIVKETKGYSTRGLLIDIISTHVDISFIYALYNWPHIDLQYVQHYKYDNICLLHLKYSSNFLQCKKIDLYQYLDYRVFMVSMKKSINVVFTELKNNV